MARGGVTWPALVDPGGRVAVVPDVEDQLPPPKRRPKGGQNDKGEQFRHGDQLCLGQVGDARGAAELLQERLGVGNEVGAPSGSAILRLRVAPVQRPDALLGGVAACPADSGLFPWESQTFAWGKAA